MKKEFNVGIIGTGFGKVIGQNFKAVNPQIKVSYGGRSREKLIKVVEEVGADGIYDNWEDLVKDPKIDLVVIASISSMHKDMFKYASKFNKHILVEKPAALFSSEIKDMIDNQSQTNLLKIVNHEGRFHPVMSFIKENVNNGKLGNILTIRSGAYLNWYSNPDYKETWNQDSSLGGGQIYSIGTHQMDLARYILGFPEITSGAVQEVIFQDSKFKQKATSDSQFAAHFTTEQGTSIQLYNDCYCFGYKDFTIEVIGDKGIVMYSDQRGLSVSYSNKQSLEQIVIPDPMPEITLGNSILTKSMKYMVKAIVEYLTNNTSTDSRFCTLEDEMETLRLFEMYR